MKLCCLLRPVFILFLIIFTFSGKFSYAIGDGGGDELLIQQQGEYKTIEESKSKNDCDLTDKEKKALADKAYTHAYDAYNILVQMVNIAERDYKSKNGVCHYLEGTSSKWWDEAFRGQLSYTAADIAGAKVVDKIKPMKYTCSFFVEGVNSDKLKKYTDWDFTKLRQRAAAGNATAVKVVSWAQTAPIGSYIQISSDVSKLICQKVEGGCKKDHFVNDCDIIVKLKGGKLDCVDTGWGGGKYDKSIDENGKCWKTKVTGSNVGPDGEVIYTNTEKVETKCKPVKYEKTDIAWTFSSPEQFKDILYDKDNPASKACLASITKIEALRGDEATEKTFIWNRAQAHKFLAALSGDVACHCERDENGSVSVNCTDPDFEADNMERPCKAVTIYENKIKENCIACNLFATILSAVQSISASAFSATANALISLLAIGYLIYIGYLTLITVSSPESQKLSKYITSLFMQGAKVAIAVLILRYPTVLYSEAINPILDGGVEFGLSLIQTNEKMAKEVGAEYVQQFDMSGEYISGATASNLTGAVKQFSDSATLMPALGQAFTCNATHDLGWKRAWIFPRLKMLIIGMVFMVFGFGIWLAIGFYLLDCIIQLGVVCAMMPFFVASWPFKMTFTYTRIGWNMFLNAFFNFILAGVAIATINGLAVHSITAVSSQEFIDMINGDMIDDLEKMLNIGGIEMIVFVICCMVAYKLPKEINNLANKFAGGASIGIGAQIGTLGESAATSVALGAAQTVGRGISAAGGSIAEHSGLKAALHGKSHDKDDDDDKSTATTGGSADSDNKQQKQQQQTSSSENNENNSDTGHDDNQNSGD